MRFVAVLVGAVLLFGCATAVAKTERPFVPAPGPPTRQNLDCSGAVPITIGESVDGTNVDAPRNVDQYSPCWSAWMPGGEAVYELTIEGGCQTVSVVVSDTDPERNVEVFLLGSCDESDCFTWGDVAAFTECLDPGVYYIVVDGPRETPFTLSVYDWGPEAICGHIDPCYTFDFSDSDHGFVTEPCGGNSAWEWGTCELIPEVDHEGNAVTNVLGTRLNENYAINAGEAATIGPVSITEDCSCMELVHYFDVEEEIDGGNVRVSTDGGSTWELVAPARRYSTIAYPDARCIAEEPVFSSDDELDFVRDWFDLEAYVGEDILIGFFFGSDYDSSYFGWYIKSVRIGGYDSPVEHRSWGTIKGMYR